MYEHANIIYFSRKIKSQKKYYPNHKKYNKYVSISFFPSTLDENPIIGILRALSLSDLHTLMATFSVKKPTRSFFE